ncbi:MAG TPA: hypothetical protein VGO65_06460 [Pseudolysinimonas sp.]|nr:hypothetical protein [Pseudolysinimonas sp.]
MATTQKRSMSERIDVGLPLISVTIAIAAAGIAIAAGWTQDGAVRGSILALAAALIAVLWIVAIRNGRLERNTRLRLQEEHPGALVERVRLWSLPRGRVDPDTPPHFIVADTREITFETYSRTVLLRIPVADLGFVDLVTAQHDRVRDKALTLVYGDDEDTVQLFTVTYDATERLRSRLRKAIGWPANGTPADTA